MPLFKEMVIIIEFINSSQENMCTCVTTPLLEECEDDTHIPEMGTWESSGTLETSKFDCKGQDTSS